MCVGVMRIGKAPDGGVSHIEGTFADGSHPWGLSVTEAIALIETGEWDFFVERPAGDRVDIRISQRNGTKFLRTGPDGDPVNNLSELPVDAAPLAGTPPQWPLSQIDPITPALQRVDEPGAPPRTQVQPTNGEYFLKSHTGGLIGAFVTLNVPFPGEPEVYVDRDDTMPGFHAADKLQRVGWGPLSRAELEDQGLGWWDWTILQPDGTYPHRFTPAEFYVRFPKPVRKTGCQVLFRVWSGNDSCYGRSAAAVVRLGLKNTPITVPPAIGGASSSGGSHPPATRTYAMGGLTKPQLTVKTPPQTKTSSDAKATLTARLAPDLGLPGPGYAAEYLDPAGKELCHPVPYELAAGGLGGAGFTPGTPSSALGVIVGKGFSSEMAAKFAKLGSPAQSSFDVDCHLTKQPATAGSVQPYVMLSPDSQIAVVVDTDRFGAQLGKAQAYDLARKQPLGAALPSNKPNTFAAIIATAAGKPVVRISADDVNATDVALRTTF